MDTSFGNTNCFHRWCLKKMCSSSQGAVWHFESASLPFPKSLLCNLCLSAALAALAAWSWGPASRKASKLWPSTTPSLTCSTWWEFPDRWKKEFDIYKHSNRLCNDIKRSSHVFRSICSNMIPLMDVTTEKCPTRTASWSSMGTPSLSSKGKSCWFI